MGREAKAAKMVRVARMLPRPRAKIKEQFNFLQVKEPTRESAIKKSRHVQCISRQMRMTTSRREKLPRAELKEENDAAALVVIGVSRSSTFLTSTMKGWPYYLWHVESIKCM